MWILIFFFVESRIHQSTHVRYYGNLLSHFFDKKFEKAMFLPTELLNSRFHEKNVSESKFLVFPHSSHRKNISSNQLFSNFFRV